MRKHLLFVLLVCGFQVNAQDEVIEHLKKELEGHPGQDTFRVNRLIKLSLNPDLPLEERVKKTAEALSVSRKISYTRGEGIALANQGYYQVRQGNKKEGDSLLRIADSLAKKTDDPELIGIVSLRLGLLITYYTGDEDGIGLGHLLKAEEAFEKSGNYVLLSACQLNAASFYQINLSNYPLAMEFILKAIHSAEKANSSSDLILAWMVLGNLYSVTGDYTKALIQLEKADSAINRNVKSRHYESLQNALGETYRLSGKYNEAINAYKLAIKYGKPEGWVTNESNLAEAYTRMDSLPLAFHYAFISLAKTNKEENEYLIGWVHGILARAYLKKGLPDSSIYFAQSGLASATKMGTIEYMRDNAEALANAYAFKKDFSRAYKYHLQFVNYRDSMLSAEVQNKTAVLQYNNDLSRKQAQISQLTQQKKAQQNFLISAMIVMILIMFTAALLLRNNWQKQRANKLLQQQKQEIDDKAVQLSVQKDNLEQSYNNVELLGEIGRKITSSLSVEKIISTAYDNVNTLMDASVFGIGIYNEDLKRIEFPATYENGEPLPFYTNAIDDKNRFGPICFNTGQEIVIGDLGIEFENHVEKVLTPHEGGQPVSIIFLPLIVKDKKSGVITVQSFKENAYSDYHLYMLRNIAIYTAIALENAESYEELNETIGSLKSTQAQLIQSEKMASLGELTAGIAHEIQNPLNFITNFSEVNTELIAEMDEEVGKGNFDAVQQITKDVVVNQQKISYHGKRADAIVKGMLQHSRNSSSVKEPTDINGLTDEYVRLTYHGFRARDKSFNTNLETSFDPRIEMINVIRQDIGRVIMNLLNNAFYAVSEKHKQNGHGYEPAVSVSTSKVGENILIRVSDNGNGIPQKVLDKVFQPFFTTKPTGQGTGLGLSLSYDIINAHGGNISVKSVEGEGSEFIIELDI